MTEESQLRDMPTPLIKIDQRAPTSIKELLMRIAWDLGSDNAKLRCRQRSEVTLTVEASGGDSEIFARHLSADIRLVDAKLREACTVLGDAARLPKPEVEGDQFVVTWRIQPEDLK